MRGRKTGRRAMFPWTRREMMEKLEADPEAVKLIAREYETSTQNLLQIKKKWKAYRKLSRFFGDLVTRMSHREGSG